MVTTGKKRTQKAEGGEVLNPEQRLAVNLKEAVKLTGISRTALYQAIKSGKLQTVPIKGRKIIRLLDLKLFLGIV